MGMGIAGSWPIFCLTTIVAGAGYGGLVLYLNSIVARRFDEHSFLMLNLINAMFGAGAILGPLAVGFANEHTKTIFLVAGILSIPCLAAGALGDRLSQPHEPQPAKNRRTQLRVTLALLGLGFLYSGVETGAGAWEATQLSWSGHTASDAARLACLFWVGLCVGRFLASPILASRAPTALMTIALLAAGTSLLFATQPHAAPYAYAICGLFLAPVLPAALEWISQNIADNQRANALLFTVSMAGSAALPALIGALARPASPELIPLTIALIAVLAAGTSRSLTRIGRSMG
jgi:fucose permease